MGLDPHFKGFARSEVLKIDHGLEVRQELIKKKIDEFNDFL